MLCTSHLKDDLLNKAANENIFIQNSQGKIGEFLNTVSDVDRTMQKYEKIAFLHCLTALKKSVCLIP